jgi:hypothetical protein
MGIGIIDKLKPISDFPVAEASDIDANGKRLDKVIDKINDTLAAIDKNIQVISDEDLDNLT